MNDDPKFTPGPWRAEGPDMFGDWNILHDGDALAVGAVVSNMKPVEEVEANAHLSAAAPDLYEAAGFALDLLERVGDSRKDAPVIDALRAARAKAEGRL